MATYFDEHADLGLVQECRVAVLGDAVDAVVHAMLLRDSGVDVHVGTSPGSAAAEAGELEGLLCVDAATAAAEADVVVVTRGDAAAGTLLELARPYLVAPMAVVAVDAVALRYGSLRLPADIDVVLVAPLAAAAVVEREFAAGRGVPTLVAVETDASGGALALALSYAKAIGGTRVGAIHCTVADAGETALFGQYAVVGGALDGLMASAFDVLSQAGYPLDLAYVACVHSLHAALERTYDGAAEPDATALERAARRAGGAAFARSHLQETLQRALSDVRADAVLRGQPRAPLRWTPLTRRARSTRPGGAYAG